ncbi:MAG TPA: hypothetical protein VFW94_21735 [Candidatus Acidoferrales bacterium]|nr:hypothetical protein [Candidatus Acidoferrales bacterium]
MPTGSKFDPFKPQQPQIPGVPAKAQPAQTAHTRPAAEPPSATSSKETASIPVAGSWPNWLRIGAAAAVVVVILGVAWWVRVSSAKSPEQPSSVEVRDVKAVSLKPVKSFPKGPGEIATARDLEQAWSSEQFLFQNAATSEVVPALVVRLPGGALWGISLREPLGRCELEYVTDLHTLRSKYGLRATHPMVADPCSGTVYDLAQYANGPNGLVRGEVVRGTAARPPIAIEIDQRGDSIIAVRMENTQ